MRTPQGVIMLTAVATNRSYHDACGIAHALDLIGERWAMLVVRELVLGPKRYTDLRADLPGISTNVLSHRLGELERSGVVRRRRLPPPAASSIYELTEWGQQLEPIIKTLGRWGARSPLRPADAHLSASSLILSLRANVDPQAVDGVAATYELRLGDEDFDEGRDERFTAEVGDGRFEVVRGGSDQADVVIRSDPVTLASVIYGDRDLADAVAAGRLSFRGDRSAIKGFLRLFALPDPAPMPEPAAATSRAGLR